ncbi:hypothetical protein Tco_0849770 [Tanacetum coccineum]
MTTLADKAILSGADNHPPMLEKDMYDSLENGVTRPKKYLEFYLLRKQYKLIVISRQQISFPSMITPEVYDFGCNHKVAKELGDREFNFSSELSSCAGSELGSELTLLAGSELKTSELDIAWLKTSEVTDKERYNADIRATNILLQGLAKDIYSLINHYTDAKDIWDNVKMLLEGLELTKEDHGSQLTVTIHNHLQNPSIPHMFPPHFANILQLDSGLSPTDNLIENLTNTLDEQATGQTAVGLLLRMFRVRLKIIAKGTSMHGRSSSGAAAVLLGELRTELGNANPRPSRPLELRLHQRQEVTNTMFMANLSSADLVYDEAGSSYDSDVLSEIHDDVQLNYVVDSHTDYTSDSNMILYDQYIKDNTVPVVQNNVSSVPNDAYMMILNDMHEPPAQYVSVTTQNNVVAKSLTAELATYKEQVELYERRARFELMEREQKIDEQLRIVITDRNIKEENLKKELHSVKLQLSSTINHNKSMVEEVTSLKKDFKQKENKYLKEFLDMKALKERVEDKLYKQDQSLQTVHLLCKPKPYYDEKNKAAIGYKNPLCITRAKQVQLTYKWS